MKETRAEHLVVDKLRPFDGHPFKVVDNEEMDQLTWSILTQGLLTPLVVRPLPNGEYEVISGHRRLHACKKAGIETVPALIYAIDRDAAAIALVDSNLQREKILPSEKAFAYKLKLEALKHQGTSSQVGTKLRSDEMIAQQTGDSRNQVQRYVRLTNLIPGILQKVDEGRIALTPAVELSYLTDAEQEDLLETMESEDCTPSLSQAIQMKALSQSGQLDMDTIFHIMTQPKANQQEKISFKVSELRDFFPRHYTAAQMMQEIILAVKERQQRLQRQRNRDAR
ncbi:MAG: ParB/RepB/Spo0J family partition protein [Oscillospiraceae bacterium]|nr:ParB/RepB/Spo0J family partition protein [Oscillospiraceae bacterium]